MIERLVPTNTLELVFKGGRHVADHRARSTLRP